MKGLFLFLFLPLSFFFSHAQDSIPWHHYGSSNSNYQGINLIDAYAFLSDNQRIPSLVVVAIIDSGADTLQQDLADRLWHNPKEIPFNNIDDDQNGYVDDVHGWNFIGGSDGRNVDGETLESVRFYRENRTRFLNKSLKQIPKSERPIYKEWKKAQAEVEGKISDYQTGYKNTSQWLEAINQAEEVLQQAAKVDTIDMDFVIHFVPQNDKETTAKRILTYSDSIGMSKDYLRRYADYYSKELEKKYNLSYYPRPIIVKDNPDDITDTLYGNNDITAASPSHGTGVSGIVGAVRNNGKGTQGIVDSVRLMILRVVPGGDERDKDVALAIIYAVNNGAKIINCSFGKAYSKHPEFVTKAIDYAIAHDVLIIHAAGNSSENNDQIPHYPTANSNQRTHWIDVAASGKFLDNQLAAGFTNYGGKSVDIFAPGVDIYSTSPHNKYRSTSGTSNATPVTTGVAALLKSYYPMLNATQIRQILFDSSTKYKNHKVYLPGSNAKMVKFSKLSQTGGIVNAYEAVKLADAISHGK